MFKNIYLLPYYFLEIQVILFHRHVDYFRALYNLCLVSRCLYAYA